MLMLSQKIYLAAAVNASSICISGLSLYDLEKLLYFQHGFALSIYLKYVMILGLSFAKQQVKLT